MTAAAAAIEVFTSEELLKHWQAQRKLTRKTIVAFPDDKFFEFSVGGMRPFAQLVSEFISMTLPVVDGVATGEWKEVEWLKPATKGQFLERWDADTAAVNEKLPQIPAHRFADVDKAFGQWEASGLEIIQYAIDNEIHHRGQGYVYLRALGIEPPSFWSRD